jgi:hypothetical protein
MGRRRRLSDVTAAAAISAAVLCLLAVQAGGAGAGQRVVISPRWDVSAVGDGGVSLRLMFIGTGNCPAIDSGPTIRVHETPENVILHVTEEVTVPAQTGPVTLCRPPSRFFESVQLGHPLAGRAIRGRFAAVLNNPHWFGFYSNGDERYEVPNVRGFSPRDALHAIALANLTARVVRRHGPLHGLRRVAVQRPSAGRRVPKDATVELVLAGR